MIKGIFLGAAALGGGFAPSIKAFAASEGFFSFADPPPDQQVKAVDHINSLREMLLDSIGPSQALKASIVVKLDAAYNAILQNQSATAVSNLNDAENLVIANLTELNNANGGLQVADDTFALAPDASFGFGQWLQKGINFLKNLGSGIITYVVTLVAAKLLCILNCTITFAKCLGRAAAQFKLCFNKMKFLLAIPFIGNGLYVIGVLVCAALLAVQVASCLVAFQACVRSC